MNDIVESLIHDLLAWLANGERSYDEVMEAWRTSCPRFPIWEDANDRGLVTKVQVNGRLYVRITSAGLALIEARNPRSLLERRDAALDGPRTRRELSAHRAAYLLRAIAGEHQNLSEK